MMVDVGLRATSEVLVGRGAEMALLGRALDSTLAEGSAIVLVAGEAGVGKTRLVQELAAEAERRRFRVAVGRCVDLGEMVWPLAPLRDLVAALVDELDQDALDLVLGSARETLSRLVPELGGAASDGPAPSSEQLCELVLGLFTRLTQRSPLLFVVEDLHWADPTTRTLFAALAGATRIRPLLLVGTFRSDELHRRHPLRPTVGELERSARCKRISLEPLDRWETALLIDALDPSASDREYAEDVHLRSGGNPFFVEELVAARRAGVASVPDSVRDVVLARAAPLDDNDFAVLGIAAAAGETSPEVLADVAQLGPGELDAALARLRAGAQLARTDRVRFRHELAREVFYDELLPGERTHLHAELARSLEARCPDRLGEIAHHWQSAHDGRRALPTHVTAGRKALSAGAAAEAEVHFGHALDLWDGVSDSATLCRVDHAGLLALAAEAAKHAGRLERAIELDLRAAAELSSVDPVREGEVWLELRDLYFFGRRYAECAEAVDRALALIPANPPSPARARALSNAARDAYHGSRRAAALEYASEAGDIANALGDEVILVDAQDALCSALTINRELEAALAVAQANVERCDPELPPELVLHAHYNLINCSKNLGRYSEVVPLARRAIALARDSGLGGPRGSWLAINLIGALAVLGRWHEADAVRIDEADLLDRSSVQGQLGYTYGVALVRQGRLDEARPLVDQTRRELLRSDWPTQAWFVAAVALFDAAEQRTEDATALITSQLRRNDARESLGAAYVLSIGMAILVDATMATPSDASARARAETLAASWIADVDESCSTDDWLAPQDDLAREDALLQLERLRGRADPERWSQLADGWQHLGFRYNEAAARYQAADDHLTGADGRSATARLAAGEQLTLAHAIASDLPAPPLLARIDALARRANLAVGFLPWRETDGFGLTRREQDVLRLLARGRSNGQIASELFISTKTASVHVSNILRKLGVTNRIEAAEYARLHDDTAS
jgi:DNA-binding CsgD family transcriptional regulator/tetratricopeptide (TPR) repeat protein